MCVFLSQFALVCEKEITYQWIIENGCLLCRGKARIHLWLASVESGDVYGPGRHQPVHHLNKELVLLSIWIKYEGETLV